MKYKDVINPKTLDEVIGQSEAIDIIKKVDLASKDFSPNLIFYGPSGSGKTTIAKLITKDLNIPVIFEDGTTLQTPDLKKKLNNVDKAVLYLDEIQALDRKRQQTILSYIEAKDITLIAATTENPYKSINKAILSRCIIVPFKPISQNDMLLCLKTMTKKLSAYLNKPILLSKESILYLINNSSGDMRILINLFLLCVEYFKSDENIDLSDLSSIKFQKRFSLDYSKDAHYDLLSALQKSIRGSNIDASVLYLAMLIKEGDLASITRRLRVIATEDISLADKNSVIYALACIDAADKVGLPEASIPLSNATIALASAYKSNEAYKAIKMANNLLESLHTVTIPDHLRDAHYFGAKKLGYGIDYKYPHDYPNHYVKQRYLPKEVNLTTPLYNPDIDIERLETIKKLDKIKNK